MQKSGESAYFGWKGKTLHQITSSLKKNKNNITDSHNIFLSNPVVHYRKEIASVDLSYGNPRLNVHIDELDGAGQTIIQTDAPTSCIGIDNTLDINLSTNKYDTGGSIQLTPTLCFSQEDTARRRVRSGGMPKKDIAIVDNAQASRKSQYYTSSSQYLYDRNKAFSQNERPYDKTMYTPSDIACDAPTIKPNNSRFFEQGAAQSGELIMRKKYEAITENLAKYQSAYGCAVANALAYASKDAGYMPKEHRGYPLTESPRFCFFEPENSYDFAAPVITSIEMGTGAAIVYFSHSASSSYSLLYMVLSEPDGIVEYGTSSPIFITGLSNQTTYTFTVAVLAIIYTSDVETGSTTNELLYTLTSQNNYTVGKNGNAQNSTAIIYIPSMYNNYIVNEVVDHGFENCTALRLVEMPSSIIKIGDYAFAGCELLQTITIPSYTVNIGYYAFRGCTSLTSIVVDTGNTTFSTDGQSLLSLSGDILLQYCTVGQTTYTVPNSVKLIDIRAFSGSQLQTVSIPDGVLEINEYAFSDCSGIETIHIPFTTSVLATGVFSGCNGLVSVTIDSMTIQTFSNNLFYQCYELESILIPTSLRYIGTYTFFECTSLTRIIIPNVLEIGDYAFSGCSNLNTIIFNGDRPSIADHSFDNVGSDASIYYYPSTIGWSELAISGIVPTSLVSISGTTIVGETLTATHTLVEAGFIDESVTVNYTWYVGNSTLYSETNDTLFLLPSYESSQIRVAVSYTVNGEYTYVLSAYTDRITLIPGSTSITNVENGDGSILVYFETATNATSYVVYRYSNDMISVPTVYNGESSPIVISGLTVDESYSFTVASIRTTQYATIYSAESAMSDSIVVYSSFGYTNNGSTWQFSGSQSHLYIPNTYSTIPINEYNIFSNITHIIIQNGVDTISDSAFQNITNLVDIILPNTLTEIGINAFNGCGNLVGINIPSSVLSIADNIFINCSKLSSLTVDTANTAYTANDNVLFDKSQTKLITYPGGKPTITYEIPSSVSEIGRYAFSTVNNLINLIVSNNVETLENGCFSSCLNLTSITFNNTIITSIPEDCFSNCTSLQSITLPDTITIIKTIAFIGCTSLQSITLPDTITSIENSVFEGCITLQSITLPSNLTQISSTIFSTCTSLTSIVIPSLVTYIDNGAFYNCSNLSSITFLGNKPTTIQGNSFYGISSSAVFYYYSNTTGWDETTTIDGDGYSYPLVDLYVPVYSSEGLIYDSNDENAVVGFDGTQSYLLIPDEVTSITIYNTNTTVKNIMIGSGVTNIYAVYSFTTLKKIIINGNSLTTIHSDAFNNCSSLVSINLPSSLTNIGINIFQGCTSLTTVTVDAENTNFKTIERALCSYDGSILYIYYDYVSTSYTIPDSVTTINESAFASNTTIQSILMNNVVILNNSVFQNCTNLSSITLSNTLTTISSRALQNLAITSIIIPASVTSIGEYAISLCSNLTSITFEGNYPTIDSTAFYENPSTAIIYYYSNTTGWDEMTSLQGYPLVVLNVDDYLSSGLIYDETDSTAVIGFEGIQSKLLIPDEVTSITIYNTNTTVTHLMIGSGVTNIYAIGFFTLLEEIIINGNALTTIGGIAFNGLTTLTTINLPSSLTTIGSAAFNNCSNLVTINLPSSLTSIGSNIFEGCTSLTTVTVDESNSNFKTIGNALCSYDGSILYSYYDYVSTSYTLPDSVTTIYESAFAFNTIIQSITMNNVVTIGNAVFQNCTNLSSITLSNTLTTIATRALQNLAITSIIIPASVTSIGEYAISLCSNLTSITFEGNYPTIESNAFLDNASSAIIYYYSGSSGWDGMTTVDGIGYSYPLVELYSDYSSDGLVYDNNNTYTVSDFTGTQSKIIIPNNVTSLDSLVFANNDTITEIIMFDNVTSIFSACFSQCTNLINIKLSNTITNISGSLFFNTSIQHIIIPATVDFIADYAFTNCSDIKTILFEGNKPTIQSYYAFLNTNSDMVIYYYADKTGWDNATQLFDYYTATALYDVGYSSEGLVYDDNDSSIVTGFTGTQTKVLIPDNITKINEWAFQSSKITHVKIGNQVTSIGNAAFIWTSLLQEVTIEGQSLTSIGDYAFWDSALITINIPSSVSSIGYAIFNLCNNIVRLTIDDTNINFKTEDKTLLSYDGSTIYTYYDNLLSYTIPDSVTTIFQDAFEYITLLQSINLNNVSVIGDYAFYYSTSLTSIILGPTVSTIGVQAFYNCTNLTSINLPSSLTSIGTNIFQGCTGLTSVTIDAENTSFITNGNALCSYDGSILYIYYDYVSTSYTIPDSVTTINESAFASNTAIQSITMNNVVILNNSVFQDCTNLSSITLSNTLTTIGNYALQNIAVTSITIPASVTSIGEYAISVCSNLTTITFEGNYPTIDSTAFAENASSAIIYYYSNTSGWSGMTSLQGYPLVDLYVPVYSSDGLIYNTNDPNAVVGFNGTQAKLLIPDNVTSITIYNTNTTVTHVMIGSGVTNIYAIGFFTLLEEIIINGNALTTIGGTAFNGLSTLTTINLPSSLTTIGSAAFNNCSSLASINLPSSLTNIGINIFQGCTSLTTVTVDAENTNFKTIGNALFSYDGSNLYSYYDYVSTSYTVPSSVTTINDLAFASNTAIQSITMNNVVTIGNAVFQDCTNLSSITLSNTLTTISIRALQNLAITSIVLPSSVTTLGEYAISLCSNLTSIIFEGNKPNMESNAILDNAVGAIIYYYSDTDGWDGTTSINGYNVIPFSKYTIIITNGGEPPDGDIIFDGYIIVNPTTNLIIGIYETGDSTNYLLPMTDTTYNGSDNIYPISYSGVNFYSNTLQNGLNTSFNNFNLYQDSSVYILYNETYQISSGYTVIIT